MHIAHLVIKLVILAFYDLYIFVRSKLWWECFFVGTFSLLRFLLNFLTFLSAK